MINKRIKWGWFLLAAVFIVTIVGMVVFMHTLSRTYISVIGQIKGADNLSWEDFDQFPHEDIGSGRYIYKYDLSDEGSLFIIGDSLDKLPSAIYISEKDGSETIIKKMMCQIYVRFLYQINCEGDRPAIHSPFPHAKLVSLCK